MALNLKELQSETAWIAELDEFFDLDLSGGALWARFTSTIDAIPDNFRDALDVYCPNRLAEFHYSVPAWTAICDASDEELTEGTEFRYIVMAH